MFLKFGRKGPVHERFIRLSDDEQRLVWEGSWLRFKPSEERQGPHRSYFYSKAA